MGGWELIFIGGMEAYIYWGDGSKSLGDESPIPLDLHPWACLYNATSFLKFCDYDAQSPSRPI